ncbi:MAG: hypothetical protein A2481_03160 [Candidatus Yonathbacteria bacterium RIFOXYC2_FULL_47_9]|nr:MAG: hypothetical protein A2481_03160 [Candidatus Yonathbacteria bacterium RIFOXYC2_FULL_47_9]HAT68369.1 hypothetical protein [Candidatus Yonathbacteria bacterium]
MVLLVPVRTLFILGGIVMQNPLARNYQTRVAACEIGLESECTIVGTTIQYGQKAVVVRLNESSVDIRLKTGPNAGQVVTDVNTVNLMFSGVFRNVMSEVVEETH